MDEKANEWMDEEVGGWVGGWMDGRIERLVGGWMRVGGWVIQYLWWPRSKG